MRYILSFLSYILIPFVISANSWTDKGNYDTSWYNDITSSFVISTPQEFAGLVFLANNNTSFDGKIIYLASDIDMGKYEWTCCNNFSGELNGNGYCLSNIHYKESTYTLDVNSFSAAVFRKLDTTGIIHNIKFENISITLLADYGGACVGGIVSTNYGLIHDCNVIGNSTARYSGDSGLGYEYSVGGIVGINYGKILNCLHNGLVESLPYNKAMFAKAYGGGIAAKNEGMIANCINYGSVISSVGYSGNWKYHTISYGWSGGICGTSSSTASINNVVNFANVKSILYLLTSYTGDYCHADGICPQGSCQNSYYSSNIEIEAPDITKNGTMLSIAQLRNESYDFTSLLNENISTIQTHPISSWGNALSYNDNEPFILNNVNLCLKGKATSQNSLLLNCVPIDVCSSMIEEKGFEYSMTGDTIIHKVLANEEFTCELYGLKSSSSYLVRAFIKTAYNVIYSTPLVLETSSLTVTTLEPSDITPTSATLHGKISVGNMPILSQGFIWKEDKNSAYNVNYTEGTDFSYTLKNLKPSTTYFYQAFAVTMDNENIYGEEQSFNSLPISICLTPLTIKPNGIYLDGFINIPVNTDVNIEYRKKGESSFVNKKVSSDNNGYFFVDIEGLENNTIYEIRSYILFNNTYIFSKMIELTTNPISVMTLKPDLSENITFWGEADGEIQFGTVGFEYRDILSPDIIESVVISGIKNENSFYATTTDVVNNRTYKVRAFFKNEDGAISYGEWIEFIPTNVDAGIHSILTDKEWNDIIIFDLLGHRLQHFNQGINIVLYPSGLRKTIVVK